MIRTALVALSNKRASLDKQKGFTLIELLVVVLIIGILAAVAIPIFLGQQATARDNAAKAQVTNAKTALAALIVTTSPTTIPTGLNPTIPGFTASAEIPITVASTSATAFCISGAHTGGGGTFSITESGAAKAGGC